MNELEQLKQENEELRRMNALKSDWISISAHQLRTSLSAIKWILKMFLDRDFGTLTPEQNGFIDKAYESTERMVNLVNEMLSLNHAQETLTYTFTKTDIVPLIENVVFDFHGESFKKHVELLFLKPNSDIPQITCDGEKIRVVLQNLIENAIKYSNEGDSVIITTTIDGNTVLLSVKDTGIGIPEEEQQKIFDKFFRATNAQKKELVGSGLGLFTTKAIVEKHGGKMWFESKNGFGTTFYVTLPFEQPKTN